MPIPTDPKGASWPSCWTGGPLRARWKMKSCVKSSLEWAHIYRLMQWLPCLLPPLTPPTPWGQLTGLPALGPLDLLQHRFLLQPHSMLAASVSLSMWAREISLGNTKRQCTSFFETWLSDAVFVFCFKRGCPIIPLTTRLLKTSLKWPLSVCP